MWRIILIKGIVTESFVEGLTTNRIVWHCNLHGYSFVFLSLTCWHALILVPEDELRVCLFLQWLSAMPTDAQRSVVDKWLATGRISAMELHWFDADLSGPHHEKTVMSFVTQAASLHIFVRMCFQQNTRILLLSGSVTIATKLACQVLSREESVTCLNSRSATECLSRQHSFITAMCQTTCTVQSILLYSSN